ncbi:MAG TPA: zinc-binding dehydrogenase [Dehalococcoidia bacterium]|nr:zinc-binding dehydrogenase [Dehalococcoidia bacterium]
MKAARLVGPRQFEILDTPTPTINQGEVLVRIENLSICGSDLLTYDKVFPEEQYPLRIGLPCHEVSGVIEESADDRIKKGQRVVALAYGGSLMEYISCPADRVVVVPEHVKPELAVLCQPVGTVLYAVQKLGSVVGKSVVIVGQGPIGMGFTELLSRAGTSQVIVTDVVQHRIDLALAHGATHGINATKEDVAERVKEITGGKLADIVVEACGLPETCNQVFDLVRVQGTVVIFGMPHGEPVFPFQWATMYSKLPNIIVTNSARAGEVYPAVVTMVDLISKGRLDLSYMISHRIPFNDVGKAYELFSNRTDNSMKVLINL